MRLTQRQEQILDMLKKEVFCSVDQISGATFTSPSSIRRDLEYLQTQGLVKRSHGGASLADGSTHIPALQNRLARNAQEKRKIAKYASSLLQDGMSILLDGSSTASFLLPYIAWHPGIELFTNSMLTALRAAELGISSHCLGGRCQRNGAVLAGEETCRAVSELYVDMFCFSSQYLDADGTISDPIQSENELRKQMLQHSKTTVFLCDSEKYGHRSLYRLAALSQIDIAVFDKAIPDLNCELGSCRIICD